MSSLPIRDMTRLIESGGYMHPLLAAVDIMNKDNPEITAQWRALIPDIVRSIGPHLKTRYRGDDPQEIINFFNRFSRGDIHSSAKTTFWRHLDKIDARIWNEACVRLLNDNGHSIVLSQIKKWYAPSVVSNSVPGTNVSDFFRKVYDTWIDLAICAGWCLHLPPSLYESPLTWAPLWAVCVYELEDQALWLVQNNAPHVFIAMDPSLLRKEPVYVGSSLYTFLRRHYDSTETVYEKLTEIKLQAQSHPFLAELFKIAGDLAGRSGSEARRRTIEIFLEKGGMLKGRRRWSGLIKDYSIGLSLRRSDTSPRVELEFKKDLKIAGQHLEIKIFLPHGRKSLCEADHFREKIWSAVGRLLYQAFVSSSDGNRNVVYKEEIDAVAAIENPGVVAAKKQIFELNKHLQATIGGEEGWVAVNQALEANGMRDETSRHMLREEFFEGRKLKVKVVLKVEIHAEKQGSITLRRVKEGVTISVPWADVASLNHGNTLRLVALGLGESYIQAATDSYSYITRVNPAQIDDYWESHPSLYLNFSSLDNFKALITSGEKSARIYEYRESFTWIRAYNILVSVKNNPLTSHPDVQSLKAIYSNQLLERSPNGFWKRIFLSDVEDKFLALYGLGAVAIHHKIALKQNMTLSAAELSRVRAGEDYALNVFITSMDNEHAGGRWFLSDVLLREEKKDEKPTRRHCLLMAFYDLYQLEKQFKINEEYQVLGLNEQEFMQFGRVLGTVLSLQYCAESYKEVWKLMRDWKRWAFVRLHRAAPEQKVIIHKNNQQVLVMLPHRFVFEPKNMLYLLAKIVKDRDGKGCGFLTCYAPDMGDEAFPLFADLVRNPQMQPLGLYDPQMLGDAEVKGSVGDREWSIVNFSKILRELVPAIPDTCVPAPKDDNDTLRTKRALLLLALHPDTATTSLKVTAELFKTVNENLEEFRQKVGF